MISRKSIYTSVTQSNMRTEIYKQYNTNIYMKSKVIKVQVSGLSIGLTTGLLSQQ